MQMQLEWGNVRLCEFDVGANNKWETCPVVDDCMLQVEAPGSCWRF